MLKKIILGVVLIIAILFTVVTLGEEEVLSNIEPDIIIAQERNEEEVVEPEPVGDIEIDEPSEEKILAREQILELIKAKQNNKVDSPGDLLVLVNKENTLPTTYTPPDLVVPDIPFSFDGYDQKRYMRIDAARALESLIKQANEDGYKLYGVSGYRSYERQKAIFINNATRLGFERANTFSALPGQSEHQTGLAMDVSSANVDFRLVTAFGETAEGIWLKENAHFFGFIIRYPKDKVHITGYQYEPWHIRYVGIDDAIQITLQNLTLEEYLVHNNTEQETP